MDIDLNVRDESVFADRRIDCESLHSFDSDLLDSDSDSDLFDSDSDSDLFDSDSEAVATVPNWGDLPHEMQWNIFQYVEPGQYLYVALTCKLFRELYMAWKWEWNITLYRNGAASIEGAALAMQLYPERFDKSEYRLYLISGAIRNNRPDVVEWMFANDWFLYVSADKCALHGHVDVIVWMWLHGVFSDLESDYYDPTLAKYFIFKEIGPLNILAVKQYVASIWPSYMFFPESATLKIETRFRECDQHVYKPEFWGFNFETDEIVNM